MTSKLFPYQYETLGIFLAGMPTKNADAVTYVKFISNVNTFWNMSKLNTEGLTLGNFKARGTAINHWKQIANFHMKRVYVDVQEIAKHPSLWGNFVWNMLYLIASKWTTKNSNCFRSIILALPIVLPCPKCASHFKKMVSCDYIKKRIKNIGTRRQAINFIICIENRVRARLNKPLIKFSIPANTNSVDSAALVYSKKLYRPIIPKKLPMKKRAIGCIWS